MRALRNSRKAFFIEIVDDFIAFFLVILALIIVFLAFDGIQRAEFINYRTSTERMDASRNLNHLLSTRLSDGTTVASILAEPTPDGLGLFEQEAKAQLDSQYDLWKVVITYPEKVDAIDDDTYVLKSYGQTGSDAVATSYLPYINGGTVRVTLMKDPIQMNYAGIG
jgi:hypothetical protein